MSVFNFSLARGADVCFAGQSSGSPVESVRISSSGGVPSTPTSPEWVAVDVNHIPRVRQRCMGVGRRRSNRWCTQVKIRARDRWCRVVHAGMRVMTRHFDRGLAAGGPRGGGAANRSQRPWGLSAACAAQRCVCPPLLQGALRSSWRACLLPCRQSRLQLTYTLVQGCRAMAPQTPHGQGYALTHRHLSAAGLNGRIKEDQGSAGVEYNKH